MYIIDFSDIFYVSICRVKEGNLKLEDGIKIIDIVIDIRIANRKSIDHTSRVFYFQLASIDQSPEVYRTTKNYPNILKTIKLESELTVYYRSKILKNIIIEFMQIHFEDQALYGYKQYKNNADVLIYIGLLAGRTKTSLAK